MPYLFCYVGKWQLIADVESVHVILSVFREIVQEEVTVVISILYDFSMECDLLHQRGYPKRSYLISPRKTGEISGHYHWFSGKRCLWNEQKNVILRTCHYQDNMYSIIALIKNWPCHKGNLLQPAMNQKPFPDQICVGSDKLLVWNLSTASPDDISQGNQFVVRGYSI